MYFSVVFMMTQVKNIYIMFSVCSLGDDKRARDCAGMGKFVFSVPSGGTHTPSLSLIHTYIAYRRENVGNVIVCSQNPHCPFSCYDYFGPLCRHAHCKKRIHYVVCQPWQCLFIFIIFTYPSHFQHKTLAKEEALWHSFITFIWG